MEIFKGQNLLEFSEHFKTDLDCKEYLANIKWKNSFKCVKCNHTASQIRKNFSRTCNKCSHTETAPANTLFHKVKFGLRKAFSYVLRCLPQQRVCLQVIWVYVLELHKRPLACLCIRLEKQ